VNTTVLAFLILIVDGKGSEGILFLLSNNGRIASKNFLEINFHISTLGLCALLVHDSFSCKEYILVSHTCGLFGNLNITLI
jgi:hypothetical protein